MKKPKSVWTKDRIQELLATNDKAVHKALIVVFNNQTADEIQAEQTRDHNGVGFTGVDAPILTSFARQLIGRGFLSAKQMAITRNKIKKYWRQLAVEIERREAAGNFVAPKVNEAVTSAPAPAAAPEPGSLAGAW